ncbi:MAG: ribonuclease P protein component [Calditrichaeota bacterium]|nr:ribonuclease P protein component [Calditrichota bacterium]
MNSKTKRFGLPRSLILKKPSEIRQVLNQGLRRSGKYVNLYTFPAKERRFAVLVSRRLGKATQRNRMKRLIREIYRLHPEWFENCLTVIYIKRFHDRFHELQDEIKRLVEKSL